MPIDTPQRLDLRVVVLIQLSLALVACPAEQPSTEGDAGIVDDVDAGNGGDDTGDESELTVESVTPSEGPLEGGTLVTLEGTGFVDGMSVRFASASGTDVTVISGEEATVVTPGATSAGAVTVVVRTPDGESDSLLNGFRYTDEAAASGVDFCMLQAQSPLQATAGAPSPGIYAVVFAEGVTPGEGQGAGVIGELGVGMGEDFAEFDYLEMDYNLDKDGLTPGDLANDEYGASVTIEQAGSYRYIARFRLESSEEWTYCDLDGTDDGVSADQLGVLDVGEAQALSIERCHLQFPHIASDAQIGAATSAFGRVVVPGVTGTGADDPRISAELLVGPAGEDPTANEGAFDVVPATFNASPLGIGEGESEYEASFEPMGEGELAFAFRFSVDEGATWTTCDLNQGPFEAAAMGYATVTDGEPDLVDFCRVWEPQLEASASGAAPTVTMELFEAAVTEGNDGANAASFTVEAGYGPQGTNPALAPYTWRELGFKGVRADNPNNYEFDGAVYDTAPAPGDYHVAVRVRHDGDLYWTYCDSDPAVADLNVASLSTLVVNP